MEVVSTPATMRILFWGLASTLGFLQAYSSRFDLDNDMISYMDMGEAYLRGNWSAALNGCWNPLLGWIWGVTQRLAHPSPAWEYPALHLLMFVIFLAAIACFEFFLNQLILWKKQLASHSEQVAVPDYVWMTIGYTVFIWAALGEISVAETNPDMLVAAFVFLAAGLVLQIRGGRDGWAGYAKLGMVLGLGYLTKAAFFPLAFLFLLTAVAGLPGFRARVLRLGLALMIFFALSGPLIVALSVDRGHPTFSESGRFNYAVHVNKIAMRHWQGEDPDSGTPLHPTRSIFSHPATFEFATPLIGTYPLWYDPTYWYEGVQTPFHPFLQANALAGGLRTVVSECTGMKGSLLALAVLWLLFSGKGRRSVWNLWPLVLVAIVGLLMYACVHVEPRYIAPFLAMLYLSVFFGVRLPPSPFAKRLVPASALILLLMLLCPWRPASTLQYPSWLHELLSPRQHNHYCETARAIHEMGIQAGDAVASVSYSNPENVKWCRLARTRLIAEVYFNKNDPRSFPNNFWNAAPEVQQSVLASFTAVGAKAAISDEPPRGAAIRGWRRIGDTNYFLYFLVNRKSEQQ